MKFALNLATGYEPQAMCEFAREAEAAGWDGFFLWDHINAWDGPLFDAWTALTAVACVTSRIRIGPMITPLPRRRPWVLARQAMTLDHLSRGRLILGVGLGHPPGEEYTRFGEDADDHARAEKLDESLDIITGLWRGEPVTYAGKHYRLDGVRFQPPPRQRTEAPDRIPIWIAGTWPLRAPFRRAARYEGVFPMRASPDGQFRFLSPADVRAVCDYVRAQRTNDAPFDLAAGLPPPGPQFPLDEYRDAGLTWWVESEFTAENVRQRLRKPLPR
jgi:alkanesulfonate monooxygenase SsuD/methylene tetrahydromethanopterin reductase-like flavin-dependent oxidoreductase (luciferase family)